MIRGLFVFSCPPLLSSMDEYLDSGFTYVLRYLYFTEMSFICHMWPSAYSWGIIEIVIDKISVILTALAK